VFLSFWFFGFFCSFFPNFCCFFCFWCFFFFLLSSFSVIFENLIISIVSCWFSFFASFGFSMLFFGFLILLFFLFLFCVCVCVCVWKVNPSFVCWGLSQPQRKGLPISS
jgi:hypothetical protein